jgi:hypothetical protein
MLVRVALFFVGFIRVCWRKTDIVICVERKKLELESLVLDGRHAFQRNRWNDLD